MEDVRYITFEKYLNKELTSEEMADFEKQLIANTDFKQEFEIYKALETSLNSTFENEEKETELKATLTNLGKKYIKEETVKKETKVISLFNYKKLLVAASIAVLIGLFVFNNGDPAYSDFANHTSLEFTVRGENDEMRSKAEEAFNTKNYTEALKLITKIGNQDLKDTEIQLYRGICYLELNSYDAAEGLFNKISNGDSAFKYKATWYKALTYLKQEQFEKCKNTLKTIPESTEEYELAQKLLKKL